MWPFRRQPLLDGDATRWLLDNFAWLIRNHGERSGFAKARLVLPAKDYFVTDGLKDHELAVKLFDQVKAYCGLADAKIQLVRIDSPPSRAEGMIFSHGKQGIGPSRWGSEEASSIAYAAKVLENPQSFIATMAHELAHRLLVSGAAQRPPIDRDKYKQLTDLTAIYFGFGVFLANSAFNVKTHANGWSYTRQGYLPEQDLVFGLALFLIVKQIDPDPALKYLKAELGNMLRRALSDLRIYAAEIAAMPMPTPGVHKHKDTPQA